ncbi:hypothetical protein B484DRAFT_416161 [Ochromonadaceae sp. CCMP2298]|nr:hypothetical protein B484DRAFT_416161 [Ochromonadaceae sp. CCMP2298]
MSAHPTFQTLVKVSPFGFTPGSVRVNSKTHQVEILSPVGAHYDPWIVQATCDHISPRAEETVFATEAQTWEKFKAFAEGFHASRSPKLTYVVIGCPGSGKSYTLFGGAWHDKRGVVPRYIEYLYSQPKDAGDKAAPQVQVTMCLLFREEVVDVLDPPKVYAHRDNLFQSAALGSVAMPLRVITTTTAAQLRDTVARGLSTASVLLANLGELSNTAHMFLTLRVYSASLATVRTVEFVEVAGVPLDDDAATSSAYDLVNQGLNQGAKEDHEESYSKDPFTGQAHRSWSASSFFNAFDQDDELDEVEAEEVPEQEHEAEGVAKPLNVDFTSSLLMYMLKDSFAPQAHLLVAACLRGYRGCNKENASCVEFLTKVEEYHTSRSAHPTHTNTHTHTLDVLSIAESCEQEAEALEARAGALRNSIDTLRDRARREALVLGKASDAMLLQTEAGIADKSARILTCARRRAYLRQHLDRVGGMRQMREEIITPPVPTFTALVVDTTLSRAAQMKAKMVFDMQEKEKEKESEVSVIEEEPENWLLPYGVKEPQPVPDSPVPGSPDSPFSGSSLTGSPHGPESSALRASPQASPARPGAGKGKGVGAGGAGKGGSGSDLSRIDDTVDDPYLLQGLVPEVPWQDSSDDFGMNQPYLLLLSPSNMGGMYARVTVYSGFTVLRRTQQSALLVSEMGQGGQGGQGVLGQGRQGNGGHGQGDDVSLDSLGSPSLVQSVVQETKEMTEAQQRVNTLAGLSEVARAKERGEFAEQLGELVGEGVVPREVLQGFLGVGGPLGKGVSGDALSGKGGLGVGLSVDPFMADSLRPVLFHIDGAGPDADLFDSLSVFGVLHRTLHSIRLIPCRPLVHKDKHKRGQKKLPRPIFRINGTPVANDNCDAIELYDQDVIQIGTLRWLTLRIPSSIPAYKTRPLDSPPTDPHLPLPLPPPQPELRLTSWELALYASHLREIRTGVVFQFLKKRNEVAHYLVDREINAIASIAERTRLMKLARFDPEWAEVDAFMRLLPVEAVCRVAHCMALCSLATLLAHDLRRHLVFACVLRPPASWSTTKRLQKHEQEAQAHTSPPRTAPSDLDYLSADKFRRVFKTYRELLSVLCYEQAPQSVDLTYPVDAEQAALSSTTVGSWLWNPDVLEARVGFMQDMYADFADPLDGRRNLAVLDVLYPPSADAFQPTQLADELVGVGFLCIDRLEYMLDLDDTVTIVGFNGFPQGIIKLTMRSWVDEIETVPKYITADVESNLTSSLGHTLIVNFYFEYIAGLSPILCADTYISFKFLGHTSVYRTPRCSGSSSHPYINATVQVRKPISHQLVDFIRSGSLEMKVFARRRPALGSVMASLRDVESMRVMPAERPGLGIIGDRGGVEEEDDLSVYSNSAIPSGSRSPAPLSRAASFNVPQLQHRDGKLKRQSSGRSDHSGGGGGGGAALFRSASRKLMQSAKLTNALTLERGELEALVTAMQEENAALKARNESLQKTADKTMVVEKTQSRACAIS